MEQEVSKGNGGADTAIVVRSETRVATPTQMLASGAEQAKALCELIEKQKLYSTISGRKYVKVEGWVPLARMNGVIPREVSNEKQEDGSYIARVQLVRVDDGIVLTEASAECGGPEEPMWNDRAPYARRSMAATRATGKACRLAYSWIVALAGFEPTPAEEMDGVEHEKPARDQGPTGKQGAYEKPGERERPDTFWTFNKKNKNGEDEQKIGVIPGEKYKPDLLDAMGFKEWKGKFYASFSPGRVEELERIVRGEDLL